MQSHGANFCTVPVVDSIPVHLQISPPTVQVFFKKHPRREEISVSDKIEILQLETRGRFLEQEVLKRFKQHASKLERELQVVELLPHLQKQHVLSVDEVEELSKENVQQQSQVLLKFVGERTPFWVVRFAECLRESPGNKGLSDLLLPGNGCEAANSVWGNSVCVCCFTFRSFQKQ